MTQAKMMQATHLFDRQLSGSSQPPELRITLRPLTEDDHAFAKSTWREGYKQSDATLLRMPWPAYKHFVSTEIADLVSTARCIGAFSDDGRIAGWLAYTPGRAVDTLHWIYTRQALGDVPCRRRGVMTALVEYAELTNRIAYTHRGPRQTVHRGRRDRSVESDRHQARGPTSDVAIADWLRSRGRNVVFVPYQEWAR